MSKVYLPPEGDEIFSGDDKELNFGVTGIANLTGYVIRFELFTFAGAQVFSKSSGSGVALEGLINFVVTLDAADTANLAGIYKYEIEGTSPLGKVITLAYGHINILADMIGA